jgi:hypothetical protein
MNKTSDKDKHEMKDKFHNLFNENMVLLEKLNNTIQELKNEIKNLHKENKSIKEDLCEMRLDNEETREIAQGSMS